MTVTTANGGRQPDWREFAIRSGVAVNAPAPKRARWAWLFLWRR